MSKPISKEDARAIFLDQIKALCAFWASGEDKGSTLERCEGVAFSILNIFDGRSGFLPAHDIIVRPHPEDKQFCISQGSDYYEDGICINDDCHLHELFFTKTKK